MSNRKSASQVRREWWLICIRERPEGRQINRSHCMHMDDDLRRLIREGKVSLHREPAHASPFCNVRRTIVRVTDGSTNPPGHIACPGCKRSSDSSNSILHKVGCPVSRTSNPQYHVKKGPKLLTAYNAE